MAFLMLPASCLRAPGVSSMPPGRGARQPDLARRGAGEAGLTRRDVAAGGRPAEAARPAGAALLLNTRPGCAAGLMPRAIPLYSRQDFGWETP